MPKVKKTTVEQVEKNDTCKCSKQELVNLLLKEIPNLFDTYPGDTLNRGAVERLAERIINAL